MAHQEHHPAGAPRSESIFDLLARFFPGTSEIAAFVTGIAVGAAILAVLALIAFSIKGHIGIWPTF